jgi:hypothetical protein
MIKDALIDGTKKYRYMLMRQWGDSRDNFVNFIMLNPSTADDKIDDPTIESCIRLAKNWGFDGFYVTNLFALRATDPKTLRASAEPIGKENDKFIEKYAQSCKLVVIAWGNQGTLKNRNKLVLEQLNKISTPHCLKKTKLNHPNHPLYIKGDTKPMKY